MRMSLRVGTLSGAPNPIPVPVVSVSSGSLLFILLQGHTAPIITSFINLQECPPQLKKE